MDKYAICLDTIHTPDLNPTKPFRESLSGLYQDSDRCDTYGHLYKLTKSGLNNVLLRSLVDDKVYVVSVDQIGTKYKAMFLDESHTLCLGYLPEQH